MPYTYDRSPGGDILRITGCDEGHAQLIITSFSGEVTVPVCVAAADVPEVAEELHAWARVESYKARWEKLKDYLGTCIDADEAVRLGMVADGEHDLAAPFGRLVSANRSTLSKMQELENGNG